VRKRRTPDVSGYEGLKTVQLAETIMESIRSGEERKFGTLP
jgi:hypothetical protein